MTNLEVNLWGQSRMPISNVWGQLWSEVIINVWDQRGTGPLDVSGDLLHELMLSGIFDNSILTPLLPQSAPDLPQEILDPPVESYL